MADMITVQDFQGYRFGSTTGLGAEQMERLIGQFSREPEKASGNLGGRNQPHFMDLEGHGPVVIKHYFRGGVLRHINRRTYLKLTGTRGRFEFELLTRIRDMGVNAPEPVAFAHKGRLFYQAWLVTKKIPEAQTLADLSRSAPERAKAVMPALIDQVKLMIEAGVLHVDLHPGNALIDAEETVFIIDFDKAKTGRKNRSMLHRRYLRRWERAVKKYGLPAFLSSRLRTGLTAEDGR